VHSNSGPTWTSIYPEIPGDSNSNLIFLGNLWDSQYLFALLDDHIFEIAIPVTPPPAISEIENSLLEGRYSLDCDGASREGSTSFCNTWVYRSAVAGGTSGLNIRRTKGFGVMVQIYLLTAARGKRSVTYEMPTN